MKRQWIWIVTAVALVGLLVGAWFLYDGLKDDYQPDSLSAQPSQEQTRAMAPDFTVYDPDGNPVKLSQLRGKPVVVNVWTSWCINCEQEMPVFQQMYEKYDGQVHFMMVNLTGQDTLADAKAMIGDTGYTFPVYYDTDNSAAQNYSTGSVPSTFFIDANGGAVTYAIGALSQDLLEQGISLIME